MSSTRRRRRTGSYEEGSDSSSDIRDSDDYTSGDDEEINTRASSECDDEEEQEQEIHEHSSPSECSPSEYSASEYSPSESDDSQGNESDDERNKDKKINDPSYVPTQGMFFLHDDRFVQGGNRSNKKSPPFGRKDKKGMGAGDKWLHDKFIDVEEEMDTSRNRVRNAHRGGAHGGGGRRRRQRKTRTRSNTSTRSIPSASTSIQSTQSPAQSPAQAQSTQSTSSTQQRITQQRTQFSRHGTSSQSHTQIRRRRLDSASVKYNAHQNQNIEASMAKLTVNQGSQNGKNEPQLDVIPNEKVHRKDKRKKPVAVVPTKEALVHPSVPQGRRYFQQQSKTIPKIQASAIVGAPPPPPPPLPPSLLSQQHLQHPQLLGVHNGHPGVVVGMNHHPAQMMYQELHHSDGTLFVPDQQMMMLPSGEIVGYQVMMNSTQPWYPPNVESTLHHQQQPPSSQSTLPPGVTRGSGGGSWLVETVRQKLGQSAHSQEVSNVVQNETP